MSSSKNPGHYLGSSVPPGQAPSSSTAEQQQQSSRSAQNSQQQRTQTGQSISDRIQSSASGLLQSTFNASQRGNGSSLTSELSSGLDDLLGEKGSSRPSAHGSASSSAQSSAFLNASQSPAASSSREHKSESFREHTRATATTPDLELNSFQQLNSVPEVSSGNQWEGQWTVHQDQSVANTGKGKGKEIAQEIVNIETNAAFKGLPKALTAEAANDNIDAIERRKYNQQHNLLPVNDFVIDPKIDLSEIDNNGNFGLENMPAFMEAQLKEDNLEEAWMKVYRQERDLMDINDRDESIEPEYDLDKINAHLGVQTAKEDVLRDDDGNDVLDLLDDPSQDLARADDAGDTDVDSDGFDFSVASHDTTHTQPSSLTPISQEKPNEVSLIPGVESLISYAEATSSGPELAEWKSLPSVSEWLDLDSSYIDEVWGGALKPYVQAAKEETKERKDRGLEGIGDGPAVRRLGMILNHIGSPNHSTPALHTERMPRAADTVKIR
ncbi:hypothetical protein KEM56_000809 [Ascosphaera pollenicola]|nr:hypothetical protein KEM56_000809 [Ascosphaera pollenicola]